MRIYVTALLLASLPLALRPAAADPADTTQLSPERLDVLDQHGYFPPAFKAAVHALVENKQELASAQDDEVRLKALLPDALKQADDAEAKLADLRAKLAVYANPVESDFTALQKILNDAKAKPADQFAVVQAYVWTYPSSPHLADAQQALDALQKKMADEALAEKQKQAAELAAQQNLLQRAIAHDLSLAEWQSFMLDRSQNELVTLLGRPSVDEGDDWIYRGAWTTDPKTGQKVGLMVFFNAGRVQTVALAPAP